ncbi:hypothetical protein FO488_11780 [Geobacter sp. FeAm09]|uniref:hypothetical protein n=1 Tax=Geobacter sp. FeAm09 TaxID=2597769 RepID=UPI0011EC76A2|nr:hypothetical protein [Geobacter sp. FeAm09]QEM68768.1 hypothetical protein FO488_11780 [Geobacter sp. FeAm09]
MGPSKLAKFFGYLIIWLFALVLIGGLFGAGALALVILGTVIIGPITLIRTLNAKPYPKYEFDSPVQIIAKKVEPIMTTNENSIWSGDYNTRVSQRLFYEDI